MTANRPPQQEKPGPDARQQAAYQQQQRQQAYQQGYAHNPQAGSEYPPPRQPPESAMMAFTSAGMQPGLESFPVLKSFQDFLETERKQSGRRMAVLTGFFLVVIVLMITAFIGVGAVFLKNLSNENSQLRLQLMARAEKENTEKPPVTPAPSPPAPPPVMSTVVKDQISEVANTASNLDSKIGKQTRDMEKMQAAMEKVENENKKLQAKLDTMTDGMTRVIAALERASRPQPTRPTPTPLSRSADAGVPERQLPPATQTVRLNLTPKDETTPITWRTLIPE